MTAEMIFLAPVGALCAIWGTHELLKLMGHVIADHLARGRQM